MVDDKFLDTPQSIPEQTKSQPVMLGAVAHAKYALILSLHKVY